MLLVDANVLLCGEPAVSRAPGSPEVAPYGAQRHRDGWLRLDGAAGISAAQQIPQAAELVEQWLGAPSALVVEPTPRHLPLLAGLLGSARTAANLVTDAHLAALALEYGARVVSFDRDFARFEGVPLFRPGD